MMNNKKKRSFALILCLALCLSSCAMGGENSRLGIHVYIGAEKIQSIEIDFLKNDNVVSTTGCSNADNTPMKKGQMFGFDKPDYGKSDISLQINIKTVSGEEFENEKTKITLPGGFEKYELEVFTDAAGEYAIRPISNERKDADG
ncbi:MAG: hypothetical protein IKJ91_01525 [Clostridia bacterium]|nr:hypothetical protein [Clostridia bacterium]